MNLSKLEEKIVEKEIAEIQKEFDRGTKIISDVIEKYGEKFRIDQGSHKEINLFGERYFSSYYLSKPHLSVRSMPESFISAVSRIAIDDFMESIEDIKDILE